MGRTSRADRCSSAQRTRRRSVASGERERATVLVTAGPDPPDPGAATTARSTAATCDPPSRGAPVGESSTRNGARPLVCWGIVGQIEGMGRRIVAALVLPLLLNVMALGAGLLPIGNSACDRMLGAPGQMATQTGTSGMQTMDAGNAPTLGDMGQMPHKTGCNLPWAPGCTSAAPCSPTATISISRFRLPLHVMPIRVAGRIMQAPDSPDRAPELPPPRA